MVCEAFILCWNEVETIHLTLAYYKKFCGRITVLDNYSDDGSDKVAESMGCDVIKFGKRGVLDDREYTNLKNNVWRGSMAQWVLVVDADEIFIPPDVWNIDVTIYRTFGWNVYSHDIPKNDWLEITTGFHDTQYSKLCCFQPSKIKEIGYVHGAHVAKPAGEISYSNGRFPLLHYRNVGGPQRLIDRHALYRPRMSEWNLRFKAGIHYLDEDTKRRHDWEAGYAQSKPFSPALISGF